MDKNLKKKKYVKPSMKVVRLGKKVQLLQVSRGNSYPGQGF